MAPHCRTLAIGFFAIFAQAQALRPKISIEARTAGFAGLRSPMGTKFGVRDLPTQDRRFQLLFMEAAGQQDALDV